MRVILHADMDAFYASVEQRDHPELRGRPVIVGGKPPRGVVSAASYEARQFGVHSAMPMIEAQRRCPHAAFVPGDMSKYAAESRRIRAVFDEFSPDVEPLSLDEAFIDVTASLRALAAPPLEIGRRLKTRVREETSLVVSVGIAPLKMVAKIASDLSKPDGLLQVEPDDVASFLAPLSISRLWGVGAVTQARLEHRGFKTIGDLASLDEASVRDEFVGLWRLARGLDARIVERDRDARSYGEENTFSRDVSDLDALCDAIGQHAEAVARRLRRDRVVTEVVRLKVKSTEKLAQPGKYRSYSRQTTLPAATDDGATIARAACALLRRGDLPLPVRLIGVAAAGIRSSDPGHAEQLSIFTPPRQRELNRALDTITQRFGAEAVHRGAGRVGKASLTTRVKRGE